MSASVVSDKSVQSEKIRITKISENFYKILVNNYVNVAVFTGPEGTLLVDTGFKETAEELEIELKKLNKGDIKYIINTHIDGDHTGGNQYLGRNAVKIAHENFYKIFSEEESLPEFLLPDITIRDELFIYFNQEKIILYPQPGSHSSEDILVHFTGQGILCIGDVYISDSFPFVRLERGGSIDQLIDNIDDILKKFDEKVKLIAGHGRDYSLEDLRRYRNMLVSTVEIVTNSVKSGKTLQEMKNEDILKNWKDWNNKRFEWLIADFWIETVFNYLKSKKN